MTDEKALNDLLFLVLTTLADLGEANTYAIYRVHRDASEHCATPLPLQSAYRYIRKLEDMGMVKVSRSIARRGDDGKTLDIPQFVMTDLGRLALKHRKGEAA